MPEALTLTFDSPTLALQITDPATLPLAMASALRGPTGPTGADSTVPGPAGPAGPQGPPGVAGESASYIAAVPVSGHIAVILDADGKCLPADASIATHVAVSGITTQAASAGDSTVAVTLGVLEHLGWTFTVGLPVFLGLDGALVQSVPATAVFSKVLGVAVSATRISIDIQPAIFK